MGLIALTLKPSEKQLSSFGYIALVMCNMIGLLMWALGVSLTPCVVIGIAGAAIFILSRISLTLVRPIYVGLNILTYPVGWLVSHTLLALFYYGVLGGVGLWFKWLKRDPLHRAYDPDAQSYWTPCQHKRTLKDYFHQY